MIEEKELICIGCPLGCHINASLGDGKVIRVAGNTCKRGDIYARKELVNPTRIVTSTVLVQGGVKRCVSVKTVSDIPKGKVFDSVRALKDITVFAPVSIGDVILENVCGTGIDVVATGNVELK